MTIVIVYFTENKAVGIMKPGHVFTVEPMINQGEYQFSFVCVHHIPLPPQNLTSLQFPVVENT